MAVESNFLAEVCHQIDKIPRRNSDLDSSNTLKGLFFSVADWIEMNSFDSTCGLVSRSLKPMTEDAVIVKVLRDHLQATPLFRSSVN